MAVLLRAAFMLMAAVGLFGLPSTARAGGTGASRAEGMGAGRVERSTRASDDTVKLIVTGDVMAPIRLKETAFRNGRPEFNFFGTLLEGLKPIVESADLAFANLETPIAASEPIKPRPFIFNAPRDYLKALKWLGFDIFSIANNHSLDQKWSGLSETMAAIEGEGLQFVGAGEDKDKALAGRVIEVRGVRIGFLAFTSFVNPAISGGTEEAMKVTQPYLNFTDRDDDLRAAVVRLKPLCDVLILSLHWGEEYEARPRKWQVKLARELHELGVDVIVGHHPHVLQPIQQGWAKDKRLQLTFFSLGNLISNQESNYTPGKKDDQDGRTRDGALVELHLSAKGIKAFRVYPTWTDNWQGPEEGIRTVRISDELRTVDQVLSTLSLSPQRTFLLSRRELLQERFSRVYKSLGLKIDQIATQAPRPGARAGSVAERASRAGSATNVVRSPASVSDKTKLD